MAEYMKIGGFTPPTKASKKTKSPNIKRFDSLDKLPPLVSGDNKALTPLVPKHLKLPKDDRSMKQALDYVAAYNRLKAQFRQNEELPYIFEGKILGEITKARLGAAAFDEAQEQLPRSQLEHYKNQINLFDDVAMGAESPRVAAVRQRAAAEKATVREEQQRWKDSDKADLDNMVTFQQNNQA